MNGPVLRCCALLLPAALAGFCPAADVVLSVGASGTGTLGTVWSVVAKPAGAADPALNQDGPLGSAGISDTAIASFAANALPGSYTFRATVSDGALSATSETTVTVVVEPTTSGAAASADTGGSGGGCGLGGLTALTLIAGASLRARRAPASSGG